jgi:hypothetical protein
MAISRQPRPKELIPYFQTIKLPQRKILPNRLLQKDNIHFVNSEIISQLVSATSPPKPSNVPNKHSHLDTLGETRAWRAGVFRRIRAHTSLTVGTLLFRLGLEAGTRGADPAGLFRLGFKGAIGEEAIRGGEGFAADETAAAASEAAFSLAKFT